MNPVYRGRLAPTPTGYLHRGHAATFACAAERAQAAGGVLIFRMEDLDEARCRPEYAQAALEDLAWLGLRWQEGPDIGGPHAPYVQSARRDYYRAVWRQLVQTGWVYPSPHSRKDVEAALHAPHVESAEGVFPVALRNTGDFRAMLEPGEVNWRFRVPEGRVLSFVDQAQGEQRFAAGRDFGDFIVWRKDGFPAYELAVVADDHAMGITEVVRGEDLLVSTARQLLLYEALQWRSPAWLHCPLVKDAQGNRLAKRAGALAIRALRNSGWSPEQIRSAEL